MYILFDIGGTNMRLAASYDGKTFQEPQIFSTPVDFSEGVRCFIDAAMVLSRGEKIEGIAGGIAGPLDGAKSMITNAPNLSGWNHCPLKQELENALKAPVHIENDTAIVGLGEAVAGAGKDEKIVAYVTVSTGVNGVRVVGGRIDENRHGFEIGHQIINEGDARCAHCDLPGHLEAYVSGTAFAKRYGKQAYEVYDSEAWEEAAHWLAVGLNNTIVHWSPDVVVLGGAMIVGEPAIPLERIQRHLKNLLNIFPEQVEIRKAALGDIGGLHGALAFVQQRTGV